MSNLAIIPVRLGSKRLPKKNIREFHGKPMFLHTVRHAIESSLFDEIHVSTECSKIAKICSDEGVPVEFIRPASLATDTASLNDLCDYILQRYRAVGRDFARVCLLWATAPLRTSHDIIRSFEMLEGQIEAVCGVTSYEHPIYCAQTQDESGFLSPVFPEKFWSSSSILPKVVCDNGSLCWFTTESFRKHGTWLPPRTKGYYMKRSSSVDIDYQDDWDMAEFLYQKYRLDSELT